MTEDGSAEVMPQPRRLRAASGGHWQANDEIEPLKLLPFFRAIHTCESSRVHHENPWLRAGEHP